MRSSNVFGKTGSAALYEKALGSEYDVVRRVHNSIDNVDIVAQYISVLLETGDIIITGENLTGPLRYAADNFVIVESRVNEVDADISAIQATVVAEQSSRINADTLLAQNITDLVGQINTANGTINAVSLRVTATEAAATALTSRVNVTESSIATLSSRTTQAETNITAAASAASAASVSAATANALAGTKNKTFLQPEPPTASAVGDLWFDSNNSFIVHRWNGTVWEIVRDSGIQVALDNLGSGGGTGGGVSTFYQANAPTATAIGDIWVDSDDSNKLYRWNGLAWEQIRDSGITLAQTQAAQALSAAASAITSAANAQATADGKVTTYFQNDTPTAEAVGDLWSDTNDGNRLYRWSGSQWVEIRDQGIAQAITAAATAEAIADSKIVSFYQNEPPTAGAVGDLWIDTNDNNKLYRWSGLAWVAARDAGIAAAQAAAAQALTDAANAISAAATAQGTADGKVVTFFQPSSPVAQAVGDLWIDTDDGNKLYRWSGSAWNVVQDASIGAAITAASTAQSTADGKIVTFYQTSAPTAAAIGDLWIDTDDNNRLYRWSGSAWVNARDASIAIAQAQANDANAAAFAANTAISIITADGFLSRDEKPEIRKQRDDIIAEYPIIRARAVSLSVSVTNYDSAYNTFNISHPAWDLSGATDSPINRNDFNFLFNDYYTKRQTVLDGIALEASKRASSVPLGNTNRVPFSRFEGDRGWVAGGAPSGGQPFRVTFEDQEYIVAQPVFSAAGQAHVLYTNPGFPVVPNERLSVSAFAQAFGISSGPNPTTWVFYIEYRDATNTNLGFTAIGNGSGFLSQQLSGFSTVPATARRAVIVLLAISSGAGTVQMALREPMVTSAAADQTVHPPYTPGPNAVDGALPNNLITIDGGGIINGIGTVGIPVNNALVPLGSNAVVNSDFTRGKFGWRWRGGGFEADWGVNRPGTPNWFGQRNVMWAYIPGTLAVGDVADLSPDTLWGGGSIANAPLFAMPVVEGDRVAATVLAAPHRCTFQFFILFFNGAGTLISAPSTSGGTPGGAANGDPANFTRLIEIADAPANTRWAIPMMRMVGTGEGLPFIFLHRADALQDCGGADDRTALFTGPL
jgi:hypothetical protein